MLSDIRERFERLRSLRRRDRRTSLILVGETACACLELLARHASRHEIGWGGAGEKIYDVFAVSGDVQLFSRAVNRALFVPDAQSFEQDWRLFVDALTQSRGRLALTGIDADVVDRLAYTAVIGFGATVDIFGTGDRGGPGTFFEALVGPVISMLTERIEAGAVLVDLPDGSAESVPVDLSFFGEARDPVLVVPTKISTRERISQAFVHQAILNKALAPRIVRSALCVGNENNMFKERGQPRGVSSATVRDTLVPRTIVQYQRYIAELSGLYYLDPPHTYQTVPLPGFPRVERFHALLTGDLEALLTG